MTTGFLTSSFASSPWNGRIFQTSTQKIIPIQELTAVLSKSQIIVLGEKHNTVAVQLAQSRMIEEVVKSTRQEGAFTTAWEFLNYTDQEKIDTAYARFISGKTDATGFLEETQGSAGNNTYIPILETTKLLQGHIIGVNIPREAKAPVVQDGIDALDKKYLPPNFEMGSTGYHQRFIEAMGGHLSSSIENHYTAQCLTDDIMAYTLQKQMNVPLLFLITGSFHADYYDGVVNRINIRLAGHSVAVIRLIDASDFDEKELNDTLPQILHDKTYGNVADFVYFVNEPSLLKSSL